MEMYRNVLRNISTGLEDAWSDASVQDYVLDVSRNKSMIWRIFSRMHQLIGPDVLRKATVRLHPLTPT